MGRVSSHNGKKESFQNINSLNLREKDLLEVLDMEERTIFEYILKIGVNMSNWIGLGWISGYESL